MEPIGDPVSIGSFQTPTPSGKFPWKGEAKYRKDSYLYGTLLWVVDMERDSYLKFFSLPTPPWKNSSGVSLALVRVSSGEETNQPQQKRIRAGFTRLGDG
jgi:hypothetical protein